METFEPMTSDLIRDDDLVKRLRSRAGACRLSGNPIMGEEFDEYASALEALQAEVDVRGQYMTLQKADADRRVEEEREACAKIAEHFTGNLWDADENALARRITDAIRSREQVSDSSTARSTASSPISQEQGEIAATRLSEGEREDNPWVSDLSIETQLVLGVFIGLRARNVPTDVMEMLAHGDGRGTIAPRALSESIREAYQSLRAQRSANDASERVAPNTPSPIGLADEEVEALDRLIKHESAIGAFHERRATRRPLGDDDLTVAEYDSLWDNARKAIFHLRAQRKASDALTRSTRDRSTSTQTDGVGNLDEDVCGGSRLPPQSRLNGGEGARDNRESYREAEPQIGESMLSVTAGNRPAPLQTCAAGSVPEGWKLVPVEATDEMVRAARAAHEGAPYLPMTLYQSMIAASPSPPVIESGWQDISTAPKDGREVLLRRDGMVIAAFYGRGELSANAGASKRHPWVVLDHTNGLNHVREDWASHWMPLPSPPVIESGECGLTYQHYRTPDEVARRWKHALDLHREHVEHLFSEYEKGTISLGEVKHRAMMLISPISDQDLRLATDEAVGIAEELHRESQTVGGEVFHADGTEPDVVEKVTRTE
jgi:hypothetical protein